MSSMITISWSSEEHFGEKKDDRESVDDTSSTLSSLTMSSDVTSDGASDVDLSSVAQASDQQVNKTSKGIPTVLGSSNNADQSRKNKTSKAQQMDFRGQLQQRSGDPKANPSRGLVRKREGSAQMDFRGLLKTTGQGNKQEPSAVAQVNKPRGKAATDQVDFRSVLTKVKSVSAFGKKLQGKSEVVPEEVRPVPPPPKQVQDFKRREANIPSTTKPNEQAESKPEEKKPRRKVSSSDLFNLLHQPKEGSSGSDYLKQRGLKKGDTQKACEQKYTIAHRNSKDGSGDEELKSQLAWRKNKSDHFFKPADPRNERPKWKQWEQEVGLPKETKPASLECEASTEEGPDVTESQPDSPSEVSPLQAPGEARGAVSSEESLSEEEADEDSSTECKNTVQIELNVNGKPGTLDPESVEVAVVLPLIQPLEDCVDLPNTKNQKEQEKCEVTTQERDNVDGKKELKKTVEVSDKGGDKAVTTTTVEEKTVKPVEVLQKDKGKKEVTAATFEKKTKTSVEVSGTDGSKKEVTKVEEKMEVHKSDGAAVTVTKTTKTTEVQRKGAPSRGTAGSIDARLAQMRKERVIAKKQAVADTKNKRAAFKQQLESQSGSKGPVRRTFSSKSNVTLLLEWCRRRTAYHEGVDITNFTTSWANGLAFCALLHYFVPDKIPYDSLIPSDKKGNWSLGFHVAGEEGIEPLLELEDVMCVDIPEPKSLITYIHFVYQHFMEKQQKEKALAGQ